MTKEEFEKTVKKPRFKVGDVIYYTLSNGEAVKGVVEEVYGGYNVGQRHYLCSMGGGRKTLLRESLIGVTPEESRLSQLAYKYAQLVVKSDEISKELQEIVNEIEAIKKGKTND